MSDWLQKNHNALERLEYEIDYLKRISNSLANLGILEGISHKIEIVTENLEQCLKSFRESTSEVIDARSKDAVANSTAMFGMVMHLADAMKENEKKS